MPGEVIKLAVPFRDLTEEEESGFAGYLRFVDEPNGKGIRGALFIVSSRGEPLDFHFTRIDVHSSFLWRAGEARRQAVTSLARALFQAATKTPGVILALADEVHPRVFTEDLEVGVPLCRVVTSENTIQAGPEDEERISDTVNLFWVNGRPPQDSPARDLIEVLSRRQLLTEPFERASAGIKEAFSS